MTQQVIEIHSIASAAAGWRRRDNGAPVACFALVTTAYAESLGSAEKTVIPLFAEDLCMGLMGKTVSVSDDDVEFVDPSGKQE